MVGCTFGWAAMLTPPAAPVYEPLELPSFNAAPNQNTWFHVEPLTERERAYALIEWDQELLSPTAWPACACSEDTLGSEKDGGRGAASGWATPSLMFRCRMSAARHARGEKTRR